jgi:hypothetical protein
MGPDQEAEEGDGQAGEGHELVAEDLLPGEGGDDFTGHAHGRQNHDVDGRMGVEPEEMLVEQGITTECGIEDADVQHSLDHEEHQSDGQDRCGQKHDDAGGVEGPDHQRQPEPGQSWSAHAMDGDDEVQTGEDR